MTPHESRLGRAAFEAYQQALGNDRGVRWEGLPEPVQRAWAAGGKAAARVGAEGNPREDRMK